MRYVLGALAFLILSPSVQAQMPGPNDREILNGVCTSKSHTAEGAIGENLTKRQSRFYCDTAAITFFPDARNHVLVSFAQKRSNHGPQIGFGGLLEPDGIMMNVNRIYLASGNLTTVSQGVCKFFFKNKRMTDVFCMAVIDEDGRRTVAIVPFSIASGQ